VFQVLLQRLTYANVMATSAVFIALGGSAYAAIKLPKNSVGSRQIKSNAISSSKVKDGSLKAMDFAAGQLPRGVQGLSGPTGPQGSAGKDGASATGLWVNVDTDGKIIDNSGAVAAVTRQGAGQYLVEFTRDVNTCARTVYVSGHRNRPVNPAFAGVSTTQQQANTKQLLVSTSPQFGQALADGPFSLVVFCS
jgi:hypothetical protein